VNTLSKICAFAMFAYLFMQLLVFIHGQHYNLLNTKMGYWFLLEMVGFVIFPMALYFRSYLTSNIKIIADSCNNNNCGYHFKPAQCFNHCFPVGCCCKICPVVDGSSCQYHHYPHPNLDFQMGNQPDAGIKRPAKMGQY
jgi:hypothetical protein